MNSSQWERAEELLKLAIWAFKEMPNRKFSVLGSNTDTYALATEITRFFKDVEESAYRED